MDTQTPEELAVEQAATREVKEEEVRAEVIAEFGFDEVDDAERIDKAVKREIEGRKKLSDAIGQKIKHRSEKEALLKDPRLQKETPPPPVEKQVPTAEIGKVVAQELEKRDLNSLEYSDELKKEIQRVAQVQGISVMQAARDPYIVFKIDEWKKEQKQEEATINRTNRSSGKKNYSVDSPPDVDMSTAEGRKEYDNWVTWAKKNGG